MTKPSANPLQPAVDRRQTELTRARYNRIAPIYNLMELLPERRFSGWRQLLWAKVPAGRILEVGVGTGKNFPYHPAGVEVVGIDLSERMLAQARRKAEKLGHPVDLHQMDVQQLDFPDRSFDAAAATFVFCSVPDPVLGLRELSRVVKPGGKILLLEHVRIDHPLIGPLMDWFNPLAIRITGANINRRTVENVRRAGLIIESVTPLGPLNVVRLIEARPAG
ncbi:MAG: class I SAM-dependent methyltransferase [Chloroflexi bacterium]|nr:MAG: class I SAM-dependent methyltransferase [Chloroflexota bacterium]